MLDNDIPSTASPDATGEGLPPDAAELAVAMRPVRFPAAAPSAATNESLPLTRFYDVQVHLTAELGRTTLKLSELMSLGVGSVVELARLVDQPVDILAQGVRLGRGDVVTVQDRYGVRITELDRREVGAASPGSSTR